MKRLTILAIPLLLLPVLGFADSADPVAEVYGQQVSEADLALPAKMVEQSRQSMSAEEFAVWEQDARRQMLAFGVMQEARKHFLAAMKLTPSDQDIDAYIQALKRMMLADADKRSQHREQLQQQLKQSGLDDQRRTEIENEIASIDELTELLKPAATGAESDQDKAAQRMVATMTVSNWNFNQGLYRKYGGRVVFQQAGLEPIEANQQFIAALKASGSYRIKDPAYQDLFKETDEYLDKEFEAVDKAEADEYFASPWWLKTDAPAQ